MMKPSTALFVIVPLLIVVSAFVFVTMRGAGAGSTMDGVAWDEQVARFVRKKVALTYVDELDEQRATQAFYKALDAYLHDLDEYCDFIPPEEHRRWKEDTAGEYAGLGIKIEEDLDGLFVVGVLPGGPADEAGIRPGEVITSAAGRDLADMDLEDVEQSGLLKGTPGSEVVLQVQPGRREEGAPRPTPLRQVTVRRAIIRPPTVLTRRVGEKDEIGVIRLTEFAEATEPDFDEALKGMMAQGIEGLVLDLRGNGGGVLPTAVGIVNRFVERGVVVRMEGRTPTANRVYEAVPEKVLAPNLPLVVLVNGYSASASEVVSGALQDHRRALLVGERTYGKFLVQQITDIPGRDMAVQLTTSRYYLPSGRSYQRPPEARRARIGGPPAPGDPVEAFGILPDVVVPLTDEQRDRLRAYRANEEARPWGEDAPNEDVPASWVDPQLQKAIDLLHGQLVLTRIREGAPSGAR